MRSLAAAAALMALAACAQAPAAPDPSWVASAGVLHRHLVERAADGRQLVNESGELLRLQADAQVPLSGGGALRGSAAIAAGNLDYRGQTQAGVPLVSDSAHRDLELGVQWCPLSPASWGQGGLVLTALQQRRQIASQPTARGLRETSTLILPGVRWTHTFDALGWQYQPSMELRASAWHRLAIGFGGVFDDADLRGGHRRELVLGLDASPAGLPWRWGFAWSHARQTASPVQTLMRNGVAVGTVRQPRLDIDDVMLRVGRSF